MNVSISSQSCRRNGRGIVGPRWEEWVPYQIYKSAGSACTGNTGNVFPTTDFKANR